jgi:hypothetical protein
MFRHHLFTGGPLKTKRAGSVAEACPSKFIGLYPAAVDFVTPIAHISSFTMVNERTLKPAGHTNIVQRRTYSWYNSAAQPRNYRIKLHIL